MSTLTKQYKAGDQMGRLHVLRDMMEIIPEEIFKQKAAPGFEKSLMKNEVTYLTEDIEVSITITRKNK